MISLSHSLLSRVSLEIVQRPGSQHGTVIQQRGTGEKARRRRGEGRRPHEIE